MPNKFIVALAAAALLAVAACTDTPPDEAGAAVTSKPSAAATRKRIAAVAKPLHEQLFDAAEALIPAEFPGNKPTLGGAGLYYRHYPETGTYVAVVVDAPGLVKGGVYVLGGSFGSQPVYVGLVSRFVAPRPCAEVTEDPLEVTLQRCHDLTGDGVIDSEVTVESSVLGISGTVVRNIALEGLAANARVSAVTAIGQHVGGPLSEIAVRVDDHTSEGNRSVLIVMDPDAGIEVARWTQPTRTPTPVWVGHALTTGKRRIPVIAPGQEQSNVTWNFLCRYTPGASGSACGANFTSIDAFPLNVASYRRHQGAWLQDVDGDGTEDVNIPFYGVFNGRRQDGGVLAVSPLDGARTWTPLSMAESARDSEQLVGGASQPPYASLAGGAQGFDSGRLYGAASAFRRDGRDRTLLVGGQPVGFYPQASTNPEDSWLVMCNVARYVGLVGGPAGQPGPRQLEWGWYFNFHQAVFRGNSGTGDLLKDAALAHGCIHRYSDARVRSAQGWPAVAFNVFRLVSPEPACEAEQRAMFSSGFTAAATRTYDTCLIGTAARPGRWMLQALDETNGNGVAALPDSYLWGYSDRLLPGGALVFIVEPFAAPTPFARPKDSSRAMNLVTLQSAPAWQFQAAGSFPVAGRPALRSDPYDANPPLAGQHLSGNFMHLQTRPNDDAPGLVDVKLENGNWVGWSPQARAVVGK